MATKTSKNLTLADWAKRQDPSGKTAKIVELLAETNEILEDMVYVEANSDLGHRVSQRTGLPAVAYRKMNQGVPSGKSKVAEITESMAMLEGIMEVDKDEADLGGKTKEFLESESVAFSEAMNQKSAETMFYGSATNAAEYVGFTERYNDLGAKNGQNILDAGGTGSNNCSVWLLGMSKSTVCGIFPKGSMAGLEMNNLGEDWATDDDGNKFRAYQSQWKNKSGICVKDWRFAVRIANINVSDLRSQTGTQAPDADTALIKLMTRAKARLPRTAGVKLSYYAPRVVSEMLQVAALDKSNSTLSVEDAINQFGDDVQKLKFLKTPIGTVDQLLENESRVIDQST